MNEAKIEVTALRLTGPAGGVVLIERAREAVGWQVRPEALPGGAEQLVHGCGVFVPGEDVAPAQHAGGLLLEKVDQCYALDQQLSDARAEVVQRAIDVQQALPVTAIG